MMFLSFLLGCGFDEPTYPVDRAVAIAQAVEAEPEQAEAILAQHGLTEDELGALLFDIAADPEQSAAYAEALGRADEEVPAEPADAAEE